MIQPILYGYSYIRPALAMGGVVADSLALFEEFDTIVLCAQEWQPTLDFPGDKSKRGFRVPFDDNDGPLDRGTLKKVHQISDLLTEEHRSGRRILVTCFAGRNRSGLVMGLTLMKRFCITGTSAIREIKAERGASALTNPVFASYLKSLKL